jgi:hypothetical protein
MIIKTSNFDDKFMSDLKQLIVNKSSTFTVKGSYKIKDFGAYISDIDIQTNVIYNQTLFNILIDKIQKSRSFIFIHMSLGFKKEFALPWKIDNIGGCDYDPEIVKEWYKNFKKMKLVPDAMYTYIENKLFSDTISIKYLIDIENELHQYSEIIWTLDDMKRGYVYFSDTKYTLLDMLQEEQPVLEFIYKYDGDFCLIDLALIDNRYKYSFEQDMYKYYTQDWYKIMKFFRWYVKREYQNEYLETVRKIDLLMAISNKIILIEKVYKYRLVSQKEFLYIENDIRLHLLNTNINFDDYTKKNIKDTVGKYLERYVEYFKSKLNINITNKVESMYKRGLEAQILVTKDIITKRVKNGVKCPFFKTDIDEYSKFVEITNKLSLDLEHTIDCFVKITEETGKDMKDLLKIAEEAMKRNNIA